MTVAVCRYEYVDDVELGATELSMSAGWILAKPICSLAILML